METTGLKLVFSSNTKDCRGVALGIYILLGLSGVGKMVSFGGKPLFRGTKCSGHISKWLFPPFPAGFTIRGGRAPGVKTHKHVRREDLVFLTLKLVYMEKCLNHTWGSTSIGSTHWLLLPLSCGLSIPRTLQFPEQRFVLWPQFSDGSQELLISICSSSLHVRTGMMISTLFSCWTTC